ncbi:hypothetical protein, partial [Hufsiella arboris]|uniref:hypothetical protein n=1 Tax=Hufsiella arboris TaxID=2695275 RepID=UPI001F37D04B
GTLLFLDKKEAKIKKRNKLPPHYLTRGPHFFSTHRSQDFTPTCKMPNTVMFFLTPKICRPTSYYQRQQEYDLLPGQQFMICSNLDRWQEANVQIVISFSEARWQDASACKN